MPQPPNDEHWSERTERWLHGERALPPAGSPEAAEPSPASALAAALRNDWAARPRDLDAARAAALRQATLLDELRAVLQRVVERIDAQARRQARRDHFDAAWRERMRGQLQALGADAAEPAWLHAFAEALAAWALDACAWLCDEVPAAGGAAAKAAAQGLRRLAAPADLGQIAWLDRLIAAADPPEAAAGETAQALLVLQARLLMQDLGDPGTAAAALERAAAGTTAPLVQVGWGELHLRAGRVAEAQAAFETAVAGAPDLIDACVGAGHVLLRLERPDDAASWFDRAIDMALDEPEAIAALERLRLAPPAALWLRLAQRLAERDAGGTAAAEERALAASGLDEARRCELLERRADRRAAAGDAPGAAADLRTAASALAGTRAQEAARLYARAAALVPQDEGVLWSWADALYLASWRPDPPYADADTLAQALAVWMRGAARGMPGPGHRWAFLARAVIAERQSLLEPARREALLWEAVEWAESLLAFDPGHTLAWTTLSRLHRALGNDENALAASRRGAGREAEDGDALEELVIMLVNTRQYDEARERLAQLRALRGASSWLDAVEAHLLINLGDGRDPEALGRAITLSAQEADGGPLWFWRARNRARARLRLGDLDGARDEARWLIERRADAAADDRSDLVFAAVLLGLHDEALAQVAAMRAEQPSLPADADRSEFAVRLLRGTPADLERADALVPGAFEAMLRRDVQAWLAGDGIDLGLQLDATGAGAAPRAVLARLLAAAAHARDTRPAEDTPQGEIEGLTARFAPRFAAGTPAWRGAVATLARLDRGEGRFAAASARWIELARADRPQWHAALPELVDDGLRAGDAADDPAVAARHWRDALAAAERQDLPAPVRLPLQVRLALAEGLGDAAVAALVDAQDRADGASGAVLVDQLAARCRAVRDGGATAAAIGRLDESLAALAAVSTGARRVRCDAARGALLPHLEAALGLRADAAATATYALSVNPIALHLGGDLYPRALQADFHTRAWAALQQRVRARTGLPLPPVALGDSRADPGLAGAFVLSIDEVGKMLGRFRAGERFAPLPLDALVAAGLDPAWLTPAPNPQGGDGTWVASAGWPAAEAAQLPLGADALDFVVESVDAALPPLLAELTGVAETVRWLGADEPAPPETAAAIRRVLGEPAELHRLARLLRALLAEQVPVVDRAELLDALRMARGEGADALLRRARLAVAPRLPGRDADPPAARLPEALANELTAWFVVERGRGYIAMPPEDTQQLLRELTRLLDGAGALVVDSPELRTALRRLARIEHPRLPVLAAEELPEAGTLAGVPS